MHFPPPSSNPRRPPSSPSAGSSGASSNGHARTSRPPPSARPHRWGLRLALTGTFLGLVTGGAALARARYLPSAHVLPGLMIDGARVPDGIDAATLRAFVDARAKQVGARSLALVTAEHDTPVLSTTLSELGLVVDVEQTVAQAERTGKDGDIIARGLAARDAREGLVDVPLVMRFDHAVAMSKLLALKEAVDTTPVSARLDLDKHETIAEKAGLYIDAHETISMVELAAKDRSQQTVVLPMKSFPPRVSSAFLKSLDISTVLAEYETFFSRNGDQQKRGKNIDNAAQKLDGIVISPGELMSFNEIIGERSESNGFEKSWEIFKGEMVEGVGGGTCQVASTFHAATFFAGFDVLERLPHSRPSAYIPMGLDSTVVYPAVDLKVRNPHPFPVVVHAKTVGGKLRVELLGKMRPIRVSFGREVVSTLPYKRKIEEDATLSGKKVLVKQHGIKGYKIKISRLFTYPDGKTKKEELTDAYPATTEIYKVPVGFDVALLPPLPGGDSEDADLGSNPSAAPPSARLPSSEGRDATAAVSPPPDSDLQFVDAPGAHAPTAAQRDPAKTVWVRH